MSQLPDSGNVTLSGGSLTYIGTGSNPGELAGALVLGAGQNNITTSLASGSTTYTPYLRFASGPTSHTAGAMVNFSPASNSYIQFQSNPPALIGTSVYGIIGDYAFYNGTDFATWNNSGPSGYPTILAATYTYTDPGESSSGGVNFRGATFTASSARNAQFPEPDGQLWRNGQRFARAQFRRTDWKYHRHGFRRNAQGLGQRRTDGQHGCTTYDLQCHR